MARSKLNPTEEDRRMVKLLAAVGPPGRNRSQDGYPVSENAPKTLSRGA